MAVFPKNSTLHYAYAIFILSYSSLTICISAFMSQPSWPDIRDQRIRRGAIVSLMIAMFATYVAEILTASITQRSFDQPQIAYLVSCTIAWAGEILFVTKTKLPVWYVCYGTWLGGIAAEAVLISVSDIFEESQISFCAMLAIRFLRIAILLLLLILHSTKRCDRAEDNERQPLMSEADSTNRGTIAVDTDTSDAASIESEDSYLGKQQHAIHLRDERLKNNNWWAYIKGYAVFLPYIWPFNNKMIQLNWALVILCLLFTVGLNLLIPLQVGKITKSIANGDADDIWIEFCIYVAFRLFAELLHPLIAKLWQPIDGYAYTELNRSLYAHVQSLSTDYREINDSNEIYYALQDSSDIILLIKTICLEVAPQLVDLVVAFVYFSNSFGLSMILVMLFTIIVFVSTTIKIMAWQIPPRRRSIKTYRKQWYTAMYGLRNWPMALSFNTIDFEVQRYLSSIKTYVKAKKHSQFYTLIIQVVQTSIFQIGILVAGFIFIKQGTKSGSDIMILITYWPQITEKIKFFSSTSEDISTKLILTEITLELIKTKPSVFDAGDAKPLELREGTVKFEGVSFTYSTQKEKTLKDITFVASQGTTTAIVGITGGGKTTTMKLLQRLYDPECGTISIDNQDIRHVTIESLHETISVVPQDILLINGSIMANVRCAKPDASDKEVQEACKAAALHDDILKFPKGYNTNIGENGLKLSGGQKQRIAISRGCLRKSSILVLDEATNQLDTETEIGILQHFETLYKGRTTLIIAHRLSTIEKADQILVIDDGRIIERGSHEQLIDSRGKYYSLWSKQYKA